ncbi:MAG TPA: hypothetical protein VKY85_13910 [Candidatus Angelobacter sp.]|nr:hypothetical protein [Candidatus Angelobacter sp.]
MVNINWQFQAAIPGGPSFVVNQPATQVDAYDVVTAKIAAGATGVAVPIQPSSGSGSVVFLVVSATQYDTTLTYTVDKVKDTRVLDGPHLLVGSGAVALLNSSAPPQTLAFSNATAKDINVQVVVGRKIP